MDDPEKPADRRPPASPYLFPIILAGMGLWFAYDGFLNAAFAEEHAGDWVLTFNRVGALLLLAWAAYDAWNQRRLQLKRRRTEIETP